MLLPLVLLVAGPIYGCQITQSTPDHRVWYWIVHVWREKDGRRVTRLWSIREATANPEKDLLRAAKDCAAGQKALGKEEK